MEIIPAIDIRDGRCVRLYQGDHNQETVFNEDPVAAALAWYSQGARWLHIVDLDGAVAGEPRNTEVVRQIMKQRSLGVVMKSALAGFVNYLAVNKSEKPTSKMTLPEDYIETGYRYSGWGNGWKVDAKK